MGNLDGNYHGASFGQLPDGEIDPNDPNFAKLSRKQQLELQLKLRQERLKKEE